MRIIPHGDPWDSLQDMEQHGKNGARLQVRNTRHAVMLAVAVIAHTIADLVAALTVQPIELDHPRELLQEALRLAQSPPFSFRPGWRDPVRAPCLSMNAQERFVVKAIAGGRHERVLGCDQPKDGAVVRH